MSKGFGDTDLATGLKCNFGTFGIELSSGFNFIDIDADACIGFVFT